MELRNNSDLKFFDKALMSLIKRGRHVLSKIIKILFNAHQYKIEFQNLIKI